VTAVDVCSVCSAPLALNVPVCSACTTVVGAAPVSDEQLPDIPGFLIERVIGSGGMGVVYRAHDVSLGRSVAIKCVASALTSTHAAQFIREARLMATIEDANVVRVYAFGEVEGKRYLVMEVVEGESLAERIRRNRRLPVDDALRIALQIAYGLRAAADKGVVHRDVKPSNVLIDQRDNARVTDFGLARSLDAPLTQAGGFAGTPHYVAPEQAEGLEVGVQADMYALGAVLFEMLVGHPPFAGSTPLAAVASQLHDPFPRVRHYRAELPGAVQQLIDRLAQKDPSLRPRSWTAVIDEISGIMRSFVAPISALDFLRSPLSPSAIMLALPIAIFLAVPMLLGLGFVTMLVDEWLSKWITPRIIHWFIVGVIFTGPLWLSALLLHRQRTRTAALSGGIDKHAVVKRS